MASIPLSVFLPVLALGCLLAGLGAGIVIERSRWTALIREGVLPDPIEVRAARAARPKGLAYYHGRGMRG